MSKLIENSLSVLLGIAALCIVAVEVHREFVPSAYGDRPRTSEYVADWRGMLSSARLIGSPNAPITLVEFTDFQCPYCRRFNATLLKLRAKYPNAIATAVVHFPLAMHDEADSAARAVECANTAGRFQEAIDFVFAHQDMLGKKPWSYFALGAGIRDTARFVACLTDSSATPLIQSGIALGAKEKVTATPTIVLNGWRYGVAPSDTELMRAVGDLMAGRRPYKHFPKAAIPIDAKAHSE